MKYLLACIISCFFSSYVYPMDTMISNLNALNSSLEILNAHLKSAETIHLLPINQLRQLGLCPLFQTLDEDTLQAENLKRDFPCFVNLKPNKQLIQLQVISQFDLTIAYASCPGQSIRTAMLLLSYSKTGNEQHLKNLNNKKNAEDFLNTLGECQWLDKDNLIKSLKIAQQKKLLQNIDPSSILIIDNVEYLSKPGFIAQEEEQQILFICDQIKNSSQFSYGIIIGTGDDLTTSMIHFFTLVIIKEGNNIQYVIADTAPAAYHLPFPGNRNNKNFARINYLIDILETGKTSVSLS